MSNNKDQYVQYGSVAEILDRPEQKHQIHQRLNQMLNGR